MKGSRSNLDQLSTTERRGAGQAPPDSVPSSTPATFALSDISGADDIKAIEALAGTGSLHRTGTNTWVLRQSLHTTDTPQFARLGLGVAADATWPLLVSGQGALISRAGTSFGTDVANSALGVNVVTSAESAFVGATTCSESTGDLPQLFVRRSRGTYDSPAAVTNGYALGQFSFAGFTGSGFVSRALILAAASENWSGSVQGTLMRFLTCLTGAGSNSERARFDGAGNFLHGTTSAPSATGIRTAGILRTGTPSGGSQGEWKLGTATSASPVSNTHKIRVDIGGTAYDLLAVSA